MHGEAILGMVIMSICGLGCGALFYGLGVSSSKRRTPMGFWANADLDPKFISDIPAYNRANGKMWKQYSIPYWICGIMALFSFVDQRMIGYSAVPLFLAGTAGIWWLIRTYNGIVKEYKT